MSSNPLIIEITETHYEGALDSKKITELNKICDEHSIKLPIPSIDINWKLFIYTFVYEGLSDYDIVTIKMHLP